MKPNVEMFGVFSPAWPKNGTCQLMLRPVPCTQMMALPPSVSQMDLTFSSMMS